MYPAVTTQPKRTHGRVLPQCPRLPHTAYNARVDTELRHPNLSVGGSGGTSQSHGRAPREQAQGRLKSRGEEDIQPTLMKPMFLAYSWKH